MGDVDKMLRLLRGSRNPISLRRRGVLHRRGFEGRKGLKDLDVGMGAGRRGHLQ